MTFKITRVDNTDISVKLQIQYYYQYSYRGHDGYDIHNHTRRQHRYVSVKLQMKHKITRVDNTDM